MYFIAAIIFIFKRCIAYLFVMLGLLSLFILIILEPNAFYNGDRLFIRCAFGFSLGAITYYPESTHFFY